MAEIDGGGLSFTSEMNNDKLDASIAETLRRVQGFSDAVVDSGKVFDSTSQGMVDEINKVIRAINEECDAHTFSIEKLKGERASLQNQIANATEQGRTAEANAAKERLQSVNGEITMRKSLRAELQAQATALEEEASKIEKTKTNVEQSSNAHKSLRSQINALRNEMAAYASQFGDQTAEYRAMADELGRLQDIQGDIQTQGSVLANDNAQFAGVLSGLQGVVGGFTAAQGAVALFASENENLQKIMLKVQSLMSITMGLQQAAATLNKDSAFSLVTLNGAKEWWNNLLDVGRGKQIAETEATVASTTAHATHATAQATDTASTEVNTAAQTQNTVATGANATAQGVQTTAAVAGTAANIGLAGAFRMVGAAIKSIPGIGWLIAAITAAVAVLAHFRSKAQEAKKAQEEFSKAIIDGCYKPIGTINELSARYTALGDNLEAKKRFIEENKKKFEELGVAVNGVTDAENLLIANKDRFIEAQIAKAKAMIYAQQAMDKTKELLEAQEKLEKTPKAYVSKKGEYTDGYGVKRKGMVIVKDSSWQEADDEVNRIQGEIEKLYEKARQAEQEEIEKLKEGNIEGIKGYAQGSLGAIEEAIRLKQEALKDLTNNDDYKKELEKINKLQAQADAITGKKTKGTGGSGGGSNKDAFLEKLSKYKAEYQRFNKWVNSGDKILIQSANKEFAGLLQQGATYIDYLKNQRDIILSVDVANRTKAQNKQLRQLNDAISEETKKTVLEAFNNELSDQLTNAKTVLEMLKVIEAKRNELANDGTELDDGKKEALDNAEKQAKEQLQQQTEQLLDEYSSYVAKKRKLEEQFNADVALLNKKRSEATTDAERAEIDAAIANRKKQYEKDSSGSGNADYDKLLEQYGTFEQRKQQIIDDYAGKRKTAQEMDNQEMIEQINKAEQEALSKFALDELKASPDWEAMFGDLDEITTKKLEELIAKINGLDGAYLGIEFDPKDLETIKGKVKEMRDEIKQRNPFKALGQAVKEYSQATDKEAKKKGLKNMFESASGAIDLVNGSLDAVVGGMSKMGIQMDEETQAILGDIGGIMDGASQVAQGIATGNPLSVIQGSIGLISSAFDLFNSRDRNAEKQIKKHKEALDQLSKAYKQLSWEIDRALGAKVYNGQMQAIHNMEQQREHLQGMWEAEQSKKKSDSGKVDEYKEQYAELGRNIQEMYESIAKDILQTTAKDFAGTLGDSLVGAFKKGEDASKAFNKTVNDVLQNAVVNQLKKNYLETQLQGALDGLQQKMGYWNGDDFVFDGLTDTEIADFKSKVQSAANNFNNALGVYKDLFKDLTDDADTSLTGSVKGVTEETASLVAGQLNAVRINQLDATAVLRQSLQALNTIAMNTQYNKYLTKIDRVISLLERSHNDSSLRSQGLS